MGLSRMRDDYIRALAGDAGGDEYAAKAVGVVNKLGEDYMAAGLVLSRVHGSAVCPASEGGGVRGAAVSGGGMLTQVVVGR